MYKYYVSNIMFDESEIIFKTIISGTWYKIAHSQFSNIYKDKLKCYILETLSAAREVN